MGAFEWVKKNYTVSANPGMPAATAQRGLYYYYHTMAKCLNVAGVDLLRSRRGPLVLEVNSSPGLEGIEAATGVDVAGEIIDYIARRVRRLRLHKSKS